MIEHAGGRVEDERLIGHQEVAFAPVPDGVEVTVRFEYQLRNRTPVTPVVDRLFIRRAVRDALARTLRRYAIELESEVSAWGAR